MYWVDIAVTVSEQYLVAVGRLRGKPEQGMEQYQMPGACGANLSKDCSRCNSKLDIGEG